MSNSKNIPVLGHLDNVLYDAAGRPAFTVIPFANCQIIRDAEGQPAHLVVPITYTEMIDLSTGTKSSKPPKTIRDWREHLGVSQEEMSKRLGIILTRYVQYEAAVNPVIETRVKCAKALGITPDQFKYKK